jgi:hypothetical protein
MQSTTHLSMPIIFTANHNPFGICPLKARVRDWSIDAVEMFVEQSVVFVDKALRLLKCRKGTNKKWRAESVGSWLFRQ